jgi:hypothetical protein
MKFRINEVIEFLNTKIDSDHKNKYKEFFEYLEKSFRETLVL